MNVLVGCEFSGVVRDAFRARGHSAYSCDILPPTGNPKFHLKCDVRELLDPELWSWDLAIFHPPCTYVARSGIHWNSRKPGRSLLTDQAVEFARMLLGADIPRIALENPIGVLSTRVRKWNQQIHPWQFGHPEAKTTCLWLKNLPPLTPTKILPLPECGHWNNTNAKGQNKLSPSADRWAKRSITYTGIAEAMADQWGNISV